MTLTSASAFLTTVGAALIIMLSTSGTAFVTTSSTSPRFSARGSAARRSPARAGAEEKVVHDLPTPAAAEATTAKPKLVTAAARDFETFFDR